MIDSEVFLTDFCDTMSRESLVVEIAVGKYYEASHYKTITPQQIKKLARTRQNVHILGSVTDRFFPEKTRARNPDVPSKNHLVFDLDLKQSIKDFEKKPTSEKKLHVIKLFNDCKDDIGSCGLGPLWFALYSGNGLHLWFKSANPIAIEETKRYELFYSDCRVKLESVLNLSLDTAFEKTPSQLIRLPLSQNCKDEKNIIQTEILFHNKEADSSKELGAILKERVSMEAATKQAQVVHIHTRPMKPFSSDEIHKIHKEALRSSLTFDKVLEHKVLPNYSQGKKRGDWVKILSPWTNEKTPSCSLNVTGKYFIDRSAHKKGSIFDFIAELNNLNIKADYLKVIKIAEEITGIHPPKQEKAKKGAETEGTEKEPKKTSYDYYNFLKEQLPNICRDVLTGQMLFREKGGAWEVAMNALPWLEAKGSEIGLKPPMIGRWLACYGREQLKPRLLIDIPQWDNVDRIKTISKCVHIKKDTGITQEHFEDYVKQWGAKIFEKLENNSVQNESEILLFIGGQGIGKDRLIYSMVGGLGRYYNEGSIGRRENDDYMLASQSLVINLSEFDQTARTDIGYLKDFITKKEVTLRKPYALEPESLTLRHSLIASSNESDLLRDSTGNRRFAPFEIEKIDWNYPIDDSLQILAQFKALKGHRVSKEAKEAMDIYIKEKTPPTVVEQVLDVFDNLMLGDWGKCGGMENVIRHHEAHGIIAEVARDVRIAPVRVTTILSKHDRSRTGTGRRREVYLPVNAPR